LKVAHLVFSPPPIGRALGFEPKKEEIKKMIADIDKDGRWVRLIAPFGLHGTTSWKKAPLESQPQAFSTMLTPAARSPLSPSSPQRHD
jgi:hypothetical protein